MATTIQGTPRLVGRKRLNFFERYLTVWVAVCMLAGLAVGTWAPGVVGALRSMEFGRGSQVNVPIAILIWLMIIPMMMKVDFGAILNIRQKPRGLLVTLFVNWLVKPFSMALIGWLFFRHLFSAWISPADANQYIAGVIILAAAPCTAMVFVWSYLAEGDGAELRQELLLEPVRPHRPLPGERCVLVVGSVPGLAVFGDCLHHDSTRGWRHAQAVAH